jgi:hypothetical protein
MPIRKKLRRSSRFAIAEFAMPRPLRSLVLVAAAYQSASVYILFGRRGVNVGDANIAEVGQNGRTFPTWPNFLNLVELSQLGPSFPLTVGWTSGPSRRAAPAVQDLKWPSRDLYFGRFIYIAARFSFWRPVHCGVCREFQGFAARRFAAARKKGAFRSL